jgi:Arc/MetJ-type ribon-helix-helix transcriptional regulator
MGTKPMLGLRVSEEQLTKVNQALEDGRYLTVSDLLKAALDRELKRLYPE